jgi:hypothetical protein
MRIRCIYIYGVYTVYIRWYYYYYYYFYVQYQDGGGNARLLNRERRAGRQVDPRRDGAVGEIVLNKSAVLRDRVRVKGEG